MYQFYTAQNKTRFDQSWERIKAAYNMTPVKKGARIIADVNFGYFGYEGRMPANYMDDPEIMLRYQCEKIQNHLDNVFDDYIPFFFPWFGVGVVPSALGCEITRYENKDPAVSSKVINDPYEIKKLRMPDWEKDGQAPDVLKFIDYAKNNSDLPVSVTDCQGPLNIALTLCGVQELFIWMYEYPGLVHELMDFCTEALIDWVKMQKKHAGQPLNGGAWPHGIGLPEGYGGIGISDDDAVVLSPELYEEFVVPYNSRVFEAFGGGTLHFCGNANHQLDNFMKIKEIRAINNYCMGKFEQIPVMREALKGKCALMLCDFSAADLEAYYAELMPYIQDATGLIFQCSITPGIALENGDYVEADGDESKIVESLKKILL